MEGFLAMAEGSVALCRQKSSFLRRVRKRDERCVITGRLVSDEEPVLFGAAHILPVALFDAVSSTALSPL